MKSLSEVRAADPMDPAVHQNAKNQKARMADPSRVGCAFRICDLYGWTDTFNTHLSVRDPAEPKCFLINAAPSSTRLPIRGCTM